MTVNENVPLDTDLVSSLGTYIRENREEINDLWDSVGAGVVVPNYDAVNMSAGQTSLVEGTHINSSGVEVVGLTADAAVNLTTMTGCVAGAIKILIAMDTNTTVIQNLASTTGGTFCLNGPGGTNVPLILHDVMTFVNIGGDGVAVDGFWLELWRNRRGW